MDERQKNILLKTARDTVESVIKGGSVPKPKTNEPELNAQCGCFVTLKNEEKLRGCIGQFTSQIQLIELVVEMAKVSATADPRFFAEPITVNELEKLDIEISVLSPLQRTDDPLSLRLGIDGIYIKKGFQTGCFLPQVATETRCNKEQFLSYCCAHKAGLPPDAWKDSATEVYFFTADVFGAAFTEIETD